jgi:uncharacterized protein YegL
MAEQIPFLDVDFVDNPEPRCPCILLVDTSSSMDGAPIAALNSGIEQFARELNEDRLAKKRVEVAIVSFGNGVQTAQDFIGATSFTPPRFEADGLTPMGEGVVHAVALLENRKAQYRAAGIQFFRPWIFLLTDGAPTDYQTHFWRQALHLVHEGETAKKMLFFGVAISGADLVKLNQLCPSSRPALKLNGLNFRDLFSWLSSSLRAVSSANPGASGLTLPSPSGWASIDT